MLDFKAIMNIKKSWSIFTSNHPKVQDFIDAIGKKGFCENQEIAIAIRYPDGMEYKTGIRVRQSDLELLETIKSLNL